LSAKLGDNQAPGTGIRGSTDPGSFSQFSTADLYYKSENLDEALDLMAVCHKVD